MARSMLGVLLVLAASASSAALAPPAAEPGPARAPAIRATVRATATVRILTPVRFGPDQLAGAEGATRRKAGLADASGQVRPAELLEFQ